MRWSRIAIAWVAAAGCTSKARPDVDLAPYQTSCTSVPGSCPAPYECTTINHASGPPQPICYVPCTSDDDCPTGFSCKPEPYDATANPPVVCYRDS
jgi:Cys-rich repeat protein